MAQIRDEDAVTGTIERCYNRCKSEVEVRGANRNENSSDVLDLDIQIAKVRAKRHAKIGPREHQDGARMATLEPIWSQDGTKMAKDTPR